MTPYEATRRAADQGIARAADGAKAWHPFMRLCVRAAAVAHPYLTMDEVLDEAEQFIRLDQPGFNLMAFGAIMQKAQKDGQIRKLADTFRPSRRQTQHRPRQVYQSLIYSPGARVTKSGIQPLLIDYGEMPPERAPMTFFEDQG